MRGQFQGNQVDSFQSNPAAKAFKRNPVAPTLGNSHFAGQGWTEKGFALNYYKHYIGDFQRDTGHLSLTERGAYLALIHHYYATETPLPCDENALFRIAKAMTKDEKKAVRAVMEFFQPVDSGLMHVRIEAELGKHDVRANKNKEIAINREKNRAKLRARTEHEPSTNRAQSVHESYTNASPTRTRPITNNQYPIKPTVPSGTGPDGPRDPVKEELWNSGKALLIDKSGMARDAAGKLIGKLIADNGESRVLDAMRHCIRESIADPRSYLCALKRESGKQAALERHNDEVLRQALEPNHA